LCNKAGLAFLHTLCHIPYMRTVTVVTKLERIKAKLENMSAFSTMGLTFTHLDNYYNSTQGTQVFMPWHMIDHVVLDVPSQETQAVSGAV